MPGGVAVVGALMHVNAFETGACGVKVEVEAPEGGAKGIGKAGPTLVVERVVLAEDGWGRGGVGTEDGLILGDVGGDAPDGVGVIHQGEFQGDAGRFGARYVAKAVRFVMTTRTGKGRTYL